MATTKERTLLAALKELNKPMLKSKKFVGFQIIEWSWKILLAYGIYAGLDSSVLLGMVTAAGAAETAFLGALAWHDRGVKSASITAASSVPSSKELDDDQ